MGQTTGSKTRDKDVELAQQVNFLKGIEFFDNFDSHELLQFLSVSKWLKVPKGRLIIKEDTVERIFYILVRGQVSVFKTINAAGDTVELTTLSTGDCFGEMSLVTEVRRTAGVITTTECFILKVEPDIISTSNVFLQLKFYKRFCEILVSRLILANERVARHEQPVLAPAALPPVGLGAEPISELVPETEVEALPSPTRRPPPAASGSQEFSLPPWPEKRERLGKVSLRRRISGNQAWAVNPVVIHKISPYLTGECENTRQLAELICLDPILCCKVIQTANSSYFRRATMVASVPHAIVTVGLEHIQKVLAETIAQSRGVGLFKGAPAVAKEFWHHAVVVGRVAELLKEIIRLELSADVYLAGLFHDLGMMGLDVVEPDFYPHLQFEESELQRSLLEAENNYLGVDHGQAGAWLGESMGLPDGYLDVMRYHHRPELARENSLIVAVVHLAELFANDLGYRMGRNEYAQFTPLESKAWSVIQDLHRPFMEVNVLDFVGAFRDEILKAGTNITGGLEIAI